MVCTRSRASLASVIPGEQQHTSVPASTPASTPANKDDAYERYREERIKENLERLRKLGIVDLALKIKTERSLSTRRSSSYIKTSPSVEKKPDGGRPPPIRRSSRLQNVPCVSYSDSGEHKKRTLMDETIVVGKGPKEEIYGVEHDNLLGSYEKEWVLFVDGYGSDGKRIYDQTKGKTCHQCRQKTLGHRTHCSKCNLVQGQFCGDCLFMRYGENVLEANENPIWICPVCRGICNCSLCRVKNGWAPTGPLYKKVRKLGFKSVAHYLIQTRRGNPSEDPDSLFQVSVKRSLLFAGVEESPFCKELTMELESGVSNMSEELRGRDGIPGSESGTIGYVSTSSLCNKILQ